jgi:P27 family predicted phage terminase small subunit
LKGNPGRRAVKTAPTLPVSPACPEAPSYLDPLGRERWNEIAPALHAAGLLTECDLATLAVHCEAFARWRVALDLLKAAPLTVVGSMGNAVPNPLVGIARSAAADMVATAKEFGLSPASRSKVSPTEPPTPGKFDGLIPA